MADAKPIDKGDKLKANSLVIYKYLDGIFEEVVLRHFSSGEITALGIFIVLITR